jgi:hypothetical protein
MVALFLMAVTAVYGEQRMDMATLLPKEVKGERERWQQSKADAWYEKDTIFDYMNGAGEIYLAYAFKKLLVREYINGSGSRIAAELYDMSSPPEAYGIFTHDTDGTPLELGGGAIYSGGLIRMWQDRFFVRLLAERETDEAKTALIEMAAFIAGHISKSGDRPQLLKYIEKKNLIPAETRYFHKNISLNIHYYLADTNILNLSEETELVLARYRVKSRKVRLLLVRYPTSAASVEAFKQFMGQYLEEEADANSPAAIRKVEGEEFIGVRLLAPFIVLVFEAPDQHSAKIMLGDIEKKIKEL